MEPTPKRWLDVVCNKYICSGITDFSVECDGSFEKIESAPDFTGTLFPHQKTLLAAAVYAERNQRLELPDGSTFAFDTAGISEPFGSGKTIVMLSLISVLKEDNAPVDPILQQTFAIDMYGQHINSALPTASVQVRYKRISRCSVVLVNSAVYETWANTIRTYFPSLKLVGIKNIRQLKALDNNALFTSDIILLYLNKSSAKTTYSSSNMMDILVEKAHGITFRRIIADDFDCMQHYPKVGLISTLFTWRVSATNKAIPIHKCGDGGLGIKNFINSSVSSRTFYNMKILPRFMLLRNADEFIKESQLPLIHYYDIVVKHVAGNLIELIKLFDKSKQNNIDYIEEMLDGDAIEEVAGRMGVDAKNVQDLLQKLLDNNYYKIEQLRAHLLRVEAIIEGIAINTLVDGETINYHTLRARIEQGAPLDDLAINRDYYEKLGAIGEAYKKEIRQCMSVIDRIKSNIEEKNCPICSIDIEGESAIIMKCCNQVVCSVCFVHALANRGFVCCHCKKNIDTSRDIIVISDKLRQKILESEPDTLQEADSGEISCSSKTTEAEEEVPIYRKYPKMEIILNIVRGVHMEGFARVEKDIPGLLPQVCDKPQEEGMPQKVLIFANYKESLRQIAETLTAQGIMFLKFTGTTQQKYNTLQLFQEEDNIPVLIINSMGNHSGFNLPCVTRIIFTHKYTEMGIYAQAIARAHRLGRTHNLEVYGVTYDV